MDILKEVARKRQMQFLRKGLRVEFFGCCAPKRGRIVGGNSGGNINVLFDDKKKPTNCHPKWGMRYFDEGGNVIAEYSAD